MLQQIFANADLTHNVLGFVSVKTRLCLKSSNKKLHSFIFGLQDNEWRLKIQRLIPVCHPSTTIQRLTRTIAINEEMKNFGDAKEIKCIDLNYFLDPLKSGKKLFCY